MIVHGCQEPFATVGDDEVWSCASVHAVCQSGIPSLFFMGSGEHDTFRLPPGIAFTVGSGTGVEFLILKIHFPPDETGLDVRTAGSGVEMVLIPKHEVQIGAGMISTGKESMVLPAHSRVVVSSVCQIMSLNVTIKPIMAFVHTHLHGTLVSGSKIDGITGHETLISARNPQEAEGFFPLSPSPNSTLQTGDLIAVQCNMVIDDHFDVLLG